MFLSSCGVICWLVMIECALNSLFLRLRPNAGSIWIGIRVDPVVLILIFLGTFSLYTCDRLGDYKDTADLKNMPGRSRWIADHATALHVRDGSIY